MAVAPLFHRVIEQTDYLLRVVDAPETSVDITSEINEILRDREELLAALHCALEMETDVRVYRNLYEQLKVKDDEVARKLTESMAKLKLMMQDANSSRAQTTLYDSYYRQAPFGAFIDKKK